MYPFEVSCGMDIVKVRRSFPDLIMMGGISKSEIALGPTRIGAIFLLKSNGRISGITGVDSMS